jgi:hypothetical protein
MTTRSDPFIGAIGELLVLSDRHGAFSSSIFVARAEDSDEESVVCETGGSRKGLDKQIVRIIFVDRRK